MGYDHHFHFIKDDLIDPNFAFMQNVDNFLFCIYFNYFDRYNSEIKEERNMILADLFRNIKSLLMGGDTEMGYKKINIKESVEEILEEKDEEKRKNKLSNLDFFVSLSFEIPHIMEKLLDLKYRNRVSKYSEMEVDLILYCILVNGLNKTKGEKFDKIKKEMEPLIKKLKNEFCEFDKNEIHKERTFIFPLRSPAGTDDNFYIINYEDDLLRKYFPDDSDDIECMFLYETHVNNKRSLDKFINGIVKDYYLSGEKGYKL